MRRRHFFFLTTLLLLTPLCAWQCWVSCFPHVTPPHEGDGVFKDLSRKMGPFAINGYEISMPKVDLKMEFEGQYVVSHLSSRPRCGIYLGIIDKRFDLKAFGGNLQIKATDSKGKVVVDVNGRLE